MRKALFMSLLNDRKDEVLGVAAITYLRTTDTSSTSDISA